MTASANVDLVRAIYAAWERGDFSSVEWADTHIEFVIPDGPAPGRWEGVAAMAEALRDYLGAWEDYCIEAEEYRQLDDGRVLVLANRSGRGRTSGLELAQMQAEGAGVFHIHNGKVTKIVRYWDRDRALADLGLAPPEAASRDAELASGPVGKHEAAPRFCSQETGRDRRSASCSWR